jgi:glycosyltransferase involved in cell wall biosynthesis
VCVGEYGESEGPWIKQRAVERGLVHASGNILIIADADIWLEPTDLLRQAVGLVAQHPRLWVVPHRPVRRLNEAATKRFKYSGQREFDIRKDQVRGTHMGIAGGGLFVMRRSDWEKIHGFDPRFEGWGGEDSSMSRAADTLIGGHRRLGGTLWHLYHLSQPKTNRYHGSEENRRLVQAYIKAKNRPALMHSLINKRYQVQAAVSTEKSSAPEDRPEPPTAPQR